MPNGPNMPIMPKLIGHSLSLLGMAYAYWAY